MTVRPDMTNGHGTCHGGFVFLLADTAFAVACNSHGPAAVAASCDIVYLRPVRVGDTLVAVAHERTTAGRSGITDVTVRRTTPSGGGQLPLSAGEAAGEVVAEFRGRSRVVKGSPAGEPDGRRGPTGTESDGAPDAEPVTSDTRSSEGAPIPLPELSQPDPLD
jgi:acyl-CoA thioesterase